MRNLFVFTLLLACILSSCETGVDQMTSSSEIIIENQSEEKSLTSAEVQYMLSLQFRKKLDQLGLANLNDPKDYLVDRISMVISTASPTNNTPQERRIRWPIQGDAELDDGLYFLDTCTGELFNAFMVSMGTMAGVWGNDQGWPECQ